MVDWIFTLKAATTGNPAIQGAKFNAEVTNNGAFGGVQIFPLNTDGNGQARVPIPWNGGSVNYYVLAEGYYNLPNQIATAPAFSGNITVPTILLNQVANATPQQLQQLASPGTPLSSTGRAPVSYTGGLGASANNLATGVSNAVSGAVKVVVIIIVILGVVYIISRAIGGANPLSAVQKGIDGIFTSIKRKVNKQVSMVY